MKLFLKKTRVLLTALLIAGASQGLMASGMSDKDVKQPGNSNKTIPARQVKQKPKPAGTPVAVSPETMAKMKRAEEARKNASQNLTDNKASAPKQIVKEEVKPNNQKPKESGKVKPVTSSDPRMQPVSNANQVNQSGKNLPADWSVKKAKLQADLKAKGYPDKEIEKRIQRMENELSSPKK